MKIIHSFWSKPSLKKQAFNSDDRAKGGWLELKYTYMSWALSCLRAKACYGRIELFTDQKGKELLIDILQLPYNEVHVVLDVMNRYHEDLWTLGKIYTHSLQTEPFIHIDNDIFLWSKFEPAFENAGLVSQNMEIDIKWYGELSKQLEAIAWLPDLVRKALTEKTNLIAANTGLVGGHQLDFFKRYADVAFEFVDRNLANLEAIGNIGLFGVFVEQFTYQVLADEQQIPIAYYLPEPIYGNFAPLIQFYGVPHKSTFIHLIGSTNKKRPSVLTHLEMRLRMEYPDYYYRIMELLEEFSL